MDDLRERVARYAHGVWRRWAREIMQEEVLTDHRTERWKYYLTTPFDDLTDDEKRTDYAEADRVLALVGAEYRPLLVQAREALESAADYSTPLCPCCGADADKNEACDDGCMYRPTIAALDARLGGKK